MAELVPVSRPKVNEKSNVTIPSTGVSIIPEDFNNIVVMSGSAKRRRLETEKLPSGSKINQKRNLDESFVKLRAPFYKTHHKQNPTEERLMTKSCEVLFECIKPYKDIRVSKRIEVRETTRTVGNWLTGTIASDVVYERKATRKVQFVSFTGESPMQSFHSYKQQPPPALLTEETEEVLPETENSQNVKTEQDQNEPGRTVSSEDFITKVFTEPKSVFIW